MTQLNTLSLSYIPTCSPLPQATTENIFIPTCVCSVSSGNPAAVRPPQSTTQCVPLLQPLRLSHDVQLDIPLILAPMAGVTTSSFRTVCRSYGASLTISEMLHANLFLSGELHAPQFGAGERIRSVQLYGSDEVGLSEATRRLVEEHGVQHIDLNFGCPAPKVLKKGGGASIPADPSRLSGIVACVVRNAGEHVPVTAKMRLGLDDNRLTYMNAGRAIEDAGGKAITLHARTAAQKYDTLGARRNWECIARLKECVGIKVFGNGDVFTAHDAVEMASSTGVDGIVIGRGALGRPWLFKDLRRAFENNGNSIAGSNDDGEWCKERAITVPMFEEVRSIMQRHIEEEISDWMARGKSEIDVLRSVRKWVRWYWQGYTGIPKWWTDRLMRAEEVHEWREAMVAFDGLGLSHDIHLITAPRGK